LSRKFGLRNLWSERVLRDALQQNLFIGFFLLTKTSGVSSFLGQKIIDGVTQTFTYDKDNHLKTIARNGTPLASYVYDLSGNVVQVSYENGVSTKQSRCESPYFVRSR